MGDLRRIVVKRLHTTPEISSGRPPATAVLRVVDL